MMNIAEVTQLAYDVMKQDAVETMYSSTFCVHCMQVALTMVYVYVAKALKISFDACSIAYICGRWRENMLDGEVWDQ